MKDIGQNWSKHLADEYEQNGYWEPLTLGQHLRIWGQKYKKHTAIVDKSKRMTYDELDQRADELAIGFHQIGIRPGNRVLLQLPNSTNFIVSCFALFRLGSIPTLSMMANGTTDIDAFCTLAEPVAYITVNKFLGFDYYALAQKMKSQHRCLKHIIIDSESSDADYELNSLGGTSTVDLFPPHYRDTALLLLSGGTTGAPKLIPRTHADYAYNAKASAKRCKLNFKSVYLAALPIAHNFPLACPGILGTLSVGGTVVLSRTPNYDETFPLIANERVTITSLVPPLVNIWLQACEWENSDLSSLSILQVGGSPLEDSVATKIKPVLGCQLQQVFGMAEGLLCFTELDAPDSVVLHTQGKPLSADDEIKIVDENGVDVHPGNLGELLVRGPYTIRGYYRAPEQNKHSFTHDGFYKSGDKVRITPEGNFQVFGRLKDQINRAGEKIDATEIETHLRSHPAIQEASLVPLPDEHLGERSCAFIICPSVDLSLNDIRKFLLKLGVSPYKVPDQLELIEEWPLTSFSKIDKRKLVSSISLNC